jgi:C1A family cysteine protease
MNFFSLFILVGLGLLQVSSSSLLDRFEQWVQDFKVKFISNEHYDSTFEKWVSNDKFVEEINTRNLTFKLGHNQFSGMDSTDFSRYLGISRILFLDTDSSDRHILQSANIEKVPESVDWVKKGGVTPVKDQGQCGSCWSFSTTGALEGAYYAKYGKLESFSEQQLVDCDNHRNGGKDLGCNGGLMDNAFTWIADNGGLCSEQDYPYVSGTTKKNGACQTKCELVKNSGLTEFVDIIKSSDEEMMLAVAQQPVAIAIEADQREFQLYKSGVFTGTCGTTLDHGVLLVGYGSQNEDDYYLVKNSWSNSWGDAGYIKLGRGKQYNGGDGQCGLLLQGSYPLL